MTDIAVVLIAKNQAWNIGRLVESVLQETSRVGAAEVVLVDSASTDATVECARRYPIGILRLHPTRQLTPAAGRYIGYTHTDGEVVLFLDGDMELYPGWLTQALLLLRDRPEVAVVTGTLIDLPPSAESPAAPQPAEDGPYPMSEIASCGGAALYRRSVLERVGSFNPFLHSDEEPELCIRIRHQGSQVVRIEHPIAYHYSLPSEAFSTLVGRWRRNLYLGAGQNIRYLLGTELLWPYVRERGFGIVPALAGLAGLMTLARATRTRDWRWPQLYLVLLLALLGGDAYRKRSVRRMAHSLLHRLFIVDGTIRGFLKRPLAPHSYPQTVDVVQPVVRIEQTEG
jgi:glycosyltransferase involved in cell wall biosynthesis